MWCGVSRRWIQVLPQLSIYTLCDSVYHVFSMVFEILISESEPTAARSFWLLLLQQMVKKATPKPSGKSWITFCEQCHLENVTLTEDKVLLLHSLCFCMCFRANSNIKCLLLKEQFISLNTFFHRPRLFTHFRTKKAVFNRCRVTFCYANDSIVLVSIKISAKKNATGQCLNHGKWSIF